MNEQKTAILIDSGCDLPKSVADKYKMKVMPLRVMYPGEDYTDGVDIDPLMVYDRFPEEIPTTSTPTLQELTEMFHEIRREGYEKVIAICISSGLSGTYNSVRMAAKEEEELKCFIFDTRNISFGSGIFAVWTAKKLEEGMSYEEIVERLPEKVSDSKLFFYMDTLKYLQKGGRIGLVASTVGSLLQLKPIISCNAEGVYYTVAKIRGGKAGKRRLVEEAVKVCQNRKAWTIYGNGAAKEEAVEVRRMIEEQVENTEVIFEKQITASMAVHTGPGLVGVLVFLNP